MTTHYKHLTLDERIGIEKARDQGESMRTIAKRLGRSPATISRELHRNAWRPSNENASYTPYRSPSLHTHVTAVQYRAGHADKRATTRAVHSHQPTVLTTDQAITYLVTKLVDG